MGYTAGGGAKGQPLFNDTPQTVADLQAAVAYAAKVGNRREGTTAERNAASGSDLWEGLEWADTTDGRTYKLIDGGWVLLFEKQWVQNDTTNTQVATRTQRGKGKIQGNNTAQLTKNVVFPTPFSNPPEIFLSYMGYRGAGAYNPISLTPGSAQRMSPMNVTATGFTAYLNSDGSLTNGSDFYFSWFALGAV
jgi:hypothetical protein